MVSLAILLLFVPSKMFNVIPNCLTLSARHVMIATDKISHGAGKMGMAFSYQKVHTSGVIILVLDPILESDFGQF